MAAKVPDLGSDFAQKLLKDLRRRRERLGFESAAAPAKSGAPSTAAPRDAYSSAQKPPQVQKPQQAAPRIGRSEASTNRLHRQGSSSIAGPGKPRRHDAPGVAHSHSIVPFQGGGGRGGGGSKQTAPAASAGADMQMALALALSNSGKLQNVELVSRQGTGSVFFGEPDRTAQARHLLTPGAHVGKVAIGVQKLNDILMAYSSGAAGARRAGGSVEIGKQLLRGAMDLEESLSMLMMLQDASDYLEMGASGNGKVLLLEGKENWKSSMPRSTSSTSARLVEIFDDDSEIDQGDNARSPSDAFMQIVPHSMSQSYRPNHNSPLHSSSFMNNCKSNATSDNKDDSKARMPGLIAKLMGLENLPSAKTAAERKGTERFVKPEALPRKSTATNSMAGTFPIRIIASERMPSRGQIKNVQTREWKISLTRSEESVLSSGFSHFAVDKHTRQTMRQMLSKQEGAERRVSVNQVVDEKIVHQDTKLNEDSNQQKTIVSAGRKMNFLQRFRKNGKNKPVTEEKAIVDENKQRLGKKQTTSIKQRGSEMKPGKTREKYNKENFANPENKAQGKNGKTSKTDQMRRQAQSKPSDKQIMEKKVQNYRRMQSETDIQKREQKRSLKSEPIHTKEKLECVTLIELKNGEGTKVDDTRSRKPSENTPSDDGVCKQSAVEMEDSSTTRGASSYQSEKELAKEISDPTTAIAQTTSGEGTKVDDTRSPKPSDNTPGDDSVCKQSAVEMEDSSTTRGVSSYQSKKELATEMSDPTTAVAQTTTGEGTKVDDTRSHKPSENTPGNDGVCKQSAGEMEDSSATRGASSYQSEKELAEEISDATTAVARTTTDSIAEINDDRVNHIGSETTQTLEAFSEGEQQHQQLQQIKGVDDQPRNGLDDTMKPSNPYDLKNHKMNVVSYDSFTENQLLLTEMLLKDPYLLETAKAITRFHVPVGVAQVNTGKWLDKGNKVLSDIGREVIRRKGKRTEAMADVSMTRAGNLKLQTLDDLIRELDSDIQSLNIPKKIQQQSDHSAAENLKMVLRSDIETTRSDANSVWDFGWNRVWDLPIEKNEVVKDLEKNILGGIITDVARELIDVSMRHGCCACES